jgi:hypothetical protein
LGYSKIAEADKSGEVDGLGNGAGYILSGRSHYLRVGVPDFVFDVVSNRIPASSPYLIGRHVHLVHQYIHI